MTLLRQIGAVVLGLSFTTLVAAADNVKLNNDKQKLGYVLGYRMALQLNIHQFPASDADRKAFLQAFEDVMDRKNPRLEPDEMQRVFVAYRQKELNKLKVMAEQNRTKGESFLAENRGKQGVQTLTSGLQYKVLQAGNGKRPGTNDGVRVHYEGKLIDGTVFDSSYQRGQPVVLTLDKVIKGWQDILPMMQTGAKWRVFVPHQLAYGERGAGGRIGPNETLIFDIELLEVVPADQLPTASQ